VDSSVEIEQAGFKVCHHQFV
jgi:hypothetical protein